MTPTENNDQQRFFPITSLSREDIAGLQGAIHEKVMTLDDSTMTYIAKKMANDYLEQLYWGSLEIIAKYIAPEAFEGNEDDDPDDEEDGAIPDDQIPTDGYDILKNSHE